MFWTQLLCLPDASHSAVANSHTLSCQLCCLPNVFHGAVGQLSYSFMPPLSHRALAGLAAGKGISAQQAGSSSAATTSLLPHASVCSVIGRCCIHLQSCMAVCLPVHLHVHSLQFSAEVLYCLGQNPFGAPPSSGPAPASNPFAAPGGYQGSTGQGGYSQQQGMQGGQPQQGFGGPQVTPD